MGKLNKVSFLLAGLLFIPAVLFAQFNNSTTSPYSRFGLGDLQPYSFGRTFAMGGASFASRNPQQINIANPASYTAIDSLGFMFEFGMNGRFSSYKNDIASLDVNDVNFRYFAMNFQITNWLATSLGLTPFSDVGYDLEVSETIENTGDIYSQYYGDGSISKAYLGFAVKPVKNISVGANFNYLFGSLTRNATVYFLDASDFYTINKVESIRLRDIGVTLGAQATLPLKEKQNITIAAVVENKPSYTGFYSDLTQKSLTASSTTDLDTLNFQSDEKNTIEFPLSFGAGLSYVKENELEINFDYYHQAWSKAKFFGSTNPVLTDLDKFAAGAEWIPDRFSIRSYLKRVAYRAGLKYERSYLTLNNQQINDFGISFGVGLPLYRSNSTINVAAEIGRRGTKKYNLIVENYAKLNVSLNIYDIWFVKRKFD